MALSEHYNSYTYRVITDQNLAQAVHRALGFRANEKYQGGLFVEIRDSGDKFSVSARSDRYIREFGMVADGTTYLKETKASPDRYLAGHDKTTTHYPEKGIVETQGLIAFTAPAPRWLEGDEAANELAWHNFLSSEITFLFRSSVLADPPEPKLEPEVSSINPNADKTVVSIADFMKSFDGPI